MKRLISILCAFCLLVCSCGCSGIFGGVHSRELGRYVNFKVVDGKKFIEWNIFTEDGYVEIGDNSFSLAENIDGEEITGDAELVFSAYATSLSHGENNQCAEGYEYISDQVYDLIGEDTLHFETKILKKGDELYGALNLYTRSSGRSGNLLCYENIKKSYLLKIQDEKLEVLQELDDTAIMAFNQTGYIAYKDKMFFSVNTQSGKETEIYKDIWWDKGPSFWSQVYVYFADDIFMICGNKSTFKDNRITLIVGKIGDTQFETLIDNKLVMEY